MALRIFVDAYTGYKANERPHLFDLDGKVFEIATVLDRWYEPSTTDFKVFVLRYDEPVDEWTLQAVSMVTNYLRGLVSSWFR